MTDTDRIEHDIVDQNNWFRTYDLESILNDLDEEHSDKGFTEIIRDSITPSPFVDEIKLWESSSKNILKSHQVITRSGALVTGFKKDYYRDGAKVTTVEAVVNRDANNFIIDYTSTITRH